MLSQIASAIDRHDYRTAAQLLKPLQQQSPQDPWVRFYAARLQEVAGKFDAAEAVYRELLRDGRNPKLIGQVRQSIQRIEQMQRQQRQQAIAQATTDPANASPGFLILETVIEPRRAAAAQSLSRIMGVDAYTARLLLPSRGWRLYRHGAIGELQVYGQELVAAGIPAFWAAVAEVQKIQVFRVHYFETIASQVTVVCQNEQDQIGHLSFSWSEVSQRVEGMLPIFEQVLDLGYRDRLERKERTQDYAHFCDLHLPGRRCLLRIHDSAYEYEKGVPVRQHSTVGAPDLQTVRTNWNGLMELLNQATSAPIWSEFTTFGETAADFAVPVERLKSHIYLNREVDRYWDPAFHLYSGLVFLRSQAVGSSPMN